MTQADPQRIFSPPHPPRGGSKNAAEFGSSSHIRGGKCTELSQNSSYCFKLFFVC